MIEFGKTLRDAREAKGLTVAQLADVTHMTVNTINELESEDFTHIPAPIYGRGFVKLYCETVGLDPKPLVAEFMDILNGNRADFIRERPTAGTAPVAPEEPAPSVETTAEVEDVPPSADDEQPASEQESPELPEQDAPELPEQDTPELPEQDTPELPEQESPELPEALPEPPPRAPVISQQDFFQDTPLPEPVASVPPKPATPLSRPVVPPPPLTPQPAAATGEPQISRYAAPIGQSRTYAAPAYGRIALLAGAAAIAIFIVLLALRSLYRATATTPAPSPAEPAVETPVNRETATPKDAPAAKKVQLAAKKAQPAAEKAKATRTPQRIPSLYID